MRLRLRVDRHPRKIKYCLEQIYPTYIGLSKRYSQDAPFSEKDFLKRWHGQWYGLPLDKGVQKDMGRVLSRAYIPKDLAHDLKAFCNRNISLSIEADAPHCPWEIFLIEDLNGRALFLCEAFVLSRRPSYGRNIPLVSPKRMTVVVAGPLDGLGVYQEGGSLTTWLKDVNHYLHWTEEASQILALCREKGIDCRVVFGKELKAADLFREYLADVMHFIGHGNYLSEIPGKGRLALSGGNFVETFRLSSKPPEEPDPLVFLSTCHAGRDSTSSLEPQGWPRAFLEWGASAVIGAWWSVHDDLARRMAVGFYREWLSGSHPDRALHTARNSLERDSRPDRLTYTIYLSQHSL